MCKIALNFNATFPNFLRNICHNFSATFRFFERNFLGGLDISRHSLHHY